MLGISVENILLGLLAIPFALLLMFGVGGLAFLLADRALGKPEEDSRTVAIVAGTILGGVLTPVLGILVLKAPVAAAGIGAAAGAILGGVLLAWQEVRAGLRRRVSRRALREAEIALTLGREGSFGDAEERIKAALLAAELALGSLDPTVAQIVSRLAELYAQAGQHVAAQTLLKRALSVYEQLYIGSNPALAGTLHQLGSLYQARGEQAMAIPVLKRSLAMYERALGKQSVDACRVHTSLAKLFLNIGKAKEAENYARAAAQGLAARLGATHPDTHAAVGLQASSLVQQGRYSEAERHLRQVLAERDPTRQDDGLLDLLLDLAQIQGNPGRSGAFRIGQPGENEAVQTYGRALQIYREAVGPSYERGRELMEACLPLMLTGAGAGPGAGHFLRALVVERDGVAARRLLDQDENLRNFVDSSGWSPLQWATFFDLDNLVESLLFRKADMNHGAGSGMPALHVAARWSRIRVVMSLIQKGVDVNLTGQGAMTAAHYAAIHGDGRVMDVLMSKNVALEVWNDWEYTPLHYAASHGHAKMVIDLLAHGQRVDLSGPKTGRTPLHAAIEGQSLSATQVLVFNGADLFLPDRQGRTPMAIARANGNPQLLEFLAAHGRAGAEGKAGKNG